jgi:Amidohydrolase family
VLLNFLATHESDTRTLDRFTIVGEKAPAFDLTSAPAREFFTLLREHHTVVDPTLCIQELVFTVAKGKLPPGLEPLMARLPVQVQRAIGSIGLDFGGKDELYRRSFDKMLESVKALRDAGVTVVAGTDAIAGISLQRELELFVKAGLTPAEAIRDATLVPARVMKADSRTGSIAAGKRADLFVVDGDPLADIRDIRKTVMTFEAGVRYPSKELYETVGVTLN